MRSLALFMSIFAVSLGAHADVVRCTDASGAVSYTDVACPPSSKQARPVQILQAPPAEERREPTPPASAAPAQPAPGRLAANPPSNSPPSSPSGPAIIPRYPADTPSQPAADPPVYILGPEDPYYDGARHVRRPPRPVRDPGPPPGQRPCQNLAGIKRNNC